MEVPGGNDVPATVGRYAHALLIQPDLVSALDRLAWILATDPDSQLRRLLVYLSRYPPTGCATAKVEQHTRDQRLLTALIGFRPADPIRGSRNSVLSEKQVQLGRMFLHMAHVVQQELEKAHRLSSDPGESDLLVRFLV